MITITFNRSKSKKLPDVLKLADKFQNVKQEGSSFSIDVTLKEVFEKWDWVNEIYWIVIEWTGTTIGYEGMIYYSKSDQKLIFYSLQQAKYNQLHRTSFELVQMYRRYEGKELFDLELKELEFKSIDQLLDSINGIRDNLK